MLAEAVDNEYYAAVFNASEDAVLIVDGSHLVDCNHAAVELLKCPSRAELLQMHPVDFCLAATPAGGDWRGLAEDHVAQAHACGSHRFDWPIRDREGREFYCEIRLRRFDWRGRTLLRATLHDRGQRSAAEQRSYAYFKSLFDNSPEGIVIIDDRDWIIDANPAFERMFQHPRGELVGRDLNDFIVPEARREEAAKYSQRARDGVTDEIGDTIRRRKDGSEVRVSIMGAPVFIDGKQIGACGIYRDMTSHFRNRARLREIEQRLCAVVENLPVILFMLDRNGIYTLSQGLGLKALGRQPEDNVGRSIFDVYANQPQLLEGFRQALAGRSWVGQHPIAQRVFETQFSPFRDADGKLTAVIGLARDATENLEIKRRLQHMTHHDVLTGLPNRTLFRERVEAAISNAAQANTSFAILLVELDHFKKINDSLGHAAGDRVLRTVAEHLANAMRATDTVARVGGDEFAVLVPHVPSARQVTIIARKLLSALAEPIPEKDMQLNMSASLGISLYPNDGRDTDTLLGNADAAMHQAKETERGSYRFFSPKMNNGALESLLLSNNMHAGLQREEFLLHYQPVIELASGNITGFEALVRWHHPERGLISPVEFIPIAEETGFITALGEWVLTEACRQMRQWLRGAPAALHMAVNLSAKQFRDCGFVERIGTTLAETGLAPEQLLVEITESTMLPNPDHTRDILGRFSAMGMPIAVDDFGTGYSSLAYLREFAVDYLKIDRSFVSNLPDEESASTIVNTIIAMAQNLGLKVIAEGVETPEQLAFLRKSGCDAAQGYYLGMPMPAAEAEAFLAANKWSRDIAQPVRLQQ